ncbi:MAG: hypothetical protein JWP36_583 [Paucimonas sp.]|nr:hypothetical protein [Paucimonas sp.]
MPGWLAYRAGHAAALIEEFIMSKRTLALPVVAASLLLAACTSPMPSGPSVMVLPGASKNFDQFRLDDMDCRNFAQANLGNVTTASASDDSGVRTAALGTVLGTVAGAAANGSRGAAVGAGAGLAMGGLAGVGAGQNAGRNVQQRYDVGYQQCMYAKGHKIPGSYSMMSSPAVQYTPAARYNAPPPPPPGMPPAPPPR